MPLLPDLDLKTGKFIFSQGNVYIFFTIFFSVFLIGSTDQCWCCTLNPSPEQKGCQMK